MLIRKKMFYDDALKAFFTINKNSKKPRYQKNLTLGDEAPKVMWAPFV
jgi:hypothetical protein